MQNEIFTNDTKSINNKKQNRSKEIKMEKAIEFFAWMKGIEVALGIGLIVIFFLSIAVAATIDHVRELRRRKRRQKNG